MDSPSYRQSILSFYSNSSFAPTTHDPYFSSSDCLSYPYYSTATPASPNHFYPFETSSPNLSLSQNLSPLSASCYNLYGSENTGNSGSDIPIFNGTGDGYWWILCIERYFKARGTPEAAKVSVAVTALQGSALQWWLEKHHHSKLSWESFTVIFLWWFKPEYRDVLPLLEDDKEEVKNNKSLCLSFQPHTTVTHGSKEHGVDEKEPELEGVEEEEESEEQRDDEEEKPIIVQKDLKEEEDSDSQFFTSGKEDESVAEADLLSPRTSMVLKNSDKGDKFFSDKVSLSLPCDIAISILGDVNILCGEPPPPPEPPDGVSIPPTNTGLTPKPPKKPPDPLVVIPPLKPQDRSFRTTMEVTKSTNPILKRPPPKPPEIRPFTTINRESLLLSFSPNRVTISQELKSRPPPFPPFFSKAPSVSPIASQQKHYKPSDPICLRVASSCPCVKNTSCVLEYDWPIFNVVPLAFHTCCQLPPVPACFTTEVCPVKSSRAFQLRHCHVILRDTLFVLASTISNIPKCIFGQAAQPIFPLTFLEDYLHSPYFFKSPINAHVIFYQILCNTWLKSMFQNFSHYLALKPFTHSSCVVTFELSKSTEAIFEATLTENGFECTFSSAQRSSIKEWDPGDQLLVFTMTRSSQFKQWDPGKICNYIHFSSTLRTRLL